MDLSSKKRKPEENGAADAGASKLTPSDTRKLLDSFSREQLLDIVQDAACRHPDVLDAVRAVADRDPAQRKLFIRGLGWDTTTDSLRTVFSAHGDLAEAIVITDKASGRSKGYGFITFVHADGALLALKEPSKLIGGRMTVTQLAAAGMGGTVASQTPAEDVALRKIFVGGVPQDMAADRLLSHFLSYGEIEEGPLGFDKQTGRSKGYALFVYKAVDGARAALVDPVKVIDGHSMICKLAADGKKGKPAEPSPSVVAPPGVGAVPNQPPSGAVSSDAVNVVSQQLPLQSSLPAQFAVSQFGVPQVGGLSSFGGLPVGASGIQVPAGLSQYYQLNGMTHSSSGMGLPAVVPSSFGIGTPGLSSAMGAQLPSSFGGDPTSGYRGVVGVSSGASQYGVPGSGAYGGLGTGTPLYLQPTSGLPSGGYPESGPYRVPSSGYQPPTGLSSGQRVPSYPSLP